MKHRWRRCFTHTGMMSLAKACDDASSVLRGSRQPPDHDKHMTTTKQLWAKALGYIIRDANSVSQGTTHLVCAVVPEAPTAPAAENEDSVAKQFLALRKLCAQRKDHLTYNIFITIPLTWKHSIKAKETIEYLKLLTASGQSRTRPDFGLVRDEYQLGQNGT